MMLEQAKAMLERVQGKMGRLALPIVSKKYLAKAYADYEPYKAVHDMSKSLSGLKKLKYDKGYEHELVMYENTRNDLKTLLVEGEKITPKAWRTEACHDLAFAEVISYNKANLERVEQNESRQQTVSKTVGRTKRKEEEL